jgi:hypothetical protein
MPQFTTSAKTLTYYVETKAVKRLGEVFGHKLDKLTQEEKYQLVTAIALMLWGCCDSVPDEDDDLDFSDLVLEEDDADACRVVNDQLVPEVTAHVMTALVILQNEPPEILAQLLPAVAEYARDDDR